MHSPCVRLLRGIIARGVDLNDKAEKPARSALKPAATPTIAPKTQPPRDWGEQLVENLNRNALANVPTN
jgi:hypothetical protein